MTVHIDLYVRQGETWSKTIVHRDAAGDPVDLTGYSAAMSVKRNPTDVETPQAYLSTGSDKDGGTLTLGTSNGEVTPSMTATETTALISGVDISALIPPEKRRRVHREETYEYDILLDDGSGNKTRAFEGRLIVQRAVTP